VFGDLCLQNIEAALLDLSQMLLTALGRDELSALFQTCNPLTDDKNDLINFYATLASNFQGVVQYNNDNRAFEGAPDVNLTINAVCAIMNSTAQSPLNNYALVNSLTLTTYGAPCLDASYQDFVNGMKNTSLSSPSVVGGARQWVYQTCTEFGYFQTSDGSNQPWTSYPGFPLSFAVQQCSDIYGEQFNQMFIQNAIQDTITNYGGTKVGGSRIIFPNGAIDPWHTLGFLPSQPDLPTVVIPDTAHCADLYPARASDPADLTAARSLINATLWNWLFRPY